MRKPSVIFSDYRRGPLAATVGLPTFPGNGGIAGAPQDDPFVNISQDIIIPRIVITFTEPAGNFAIVYMKPKAISQAYNNAIAPIGIGVQSAGEYNPNFPIFLPKDQTLVILTNTAATVSPWSALTYMEYYVNVDTESQSSVIPRADPQTMY